MSKEKIWHLIARKLTDEASDNELSELQQLLNEQESSHHEVRLMTEFWELEPEHDADYLEATYLIHCTKMEKMGILPGNSSQKIQEQEFHTPSYTITRKVMLLSTVVVCLFLAGYMYTRYSRNNSSKEIISKTKKSEPVKGVLETQNATRTNFILPDGSSVWLNAGSKLNYEKIGQQGNREVYLTGEGYFDVVSNPKRPFIIHTSTIDIKVLGTEFNVKAYPDDATVETSLIHGSVQVFLKNNPEKKYLLKPNQKLVLYKSDEGLKAKPTINSVVFISPKVAIEKLKYVNSSSGISETAWVRNMLSFEDESFADVAHKMERWYDAEFEFINTNLANERLTGSFQNESLKEAMEALRFSFRFNFKMNGKKVIIY